MTAPAMPGQLLDLPLPPDLVLCLGYPSNARYVVFLLDGDDVLYTDGVQTGHAARWAFHEYTRHRAVEPLLREFDMTVDCLVIDQVGCRASIATGPEAAEFLREHRPPLPPSPTTAEPASLVEKLTTGWEEAQVSQETVRRAMDEQRGRVGRMLSWLDQCPTAKPKDGLGA